MSSELPRQSTRETYAERRARIGYTHVVRDSGGKLHLERALWGNHEAMCGRRNVDRWPEKSAKCWEDNPDQRCRNCEAPLGPRAVLKP